MPGLCAEGLGGPSLQAAGCTLHDDLVSQSIFGFSGALAPVPEMGYGFGLGFAVRKAQGLSPVPGSVGEFFWGGATGTYFWIDPQEQMVVVLMLQAPEQRLRYRYLSRRLVYAAVTGPLRWRRR